MPPTLSDVAREVGVAPSTVADILRGRAGYSQATRRRTFEVANRLNFVPNQLAQSLQKQHSRTIGIAGRLDNPAVTGPMLKAIVDGLVAKGYMPLLCECSSGSGAQERAERELRGRRVDGIILSGGGDDATLMDILAKNVPCVAIRDANTLNIPCVVADHVNALANGVQWLADRGHRRIAFMGLGNAGVMSHQHNSHRLKIEGYRAAMERLGLFDEALLLDSDIPPGKTREFVVKHRELFEGVTAVLASNDRVALEVIHGLAELGLRVPADCSVIGFDDTEFALAVRPTLTTFQPRRAEVGAKAVEMMMDLIAGREVQPVTVMPELIERESAGPIDSSAKR